MIIQNNIATASEGKKLKVSLGLFESLCLTGTTIVINSEIKTFIPENIIEVTPVVIDSTLYYVNVNNYDSLVTELIRIKYSVDKELAIMANSRINKDTEEEKEFLEYRQYCKDLAKKLLNE